MSDVEDRTDRPGTVCPVHLGDAASETDKAGEADILATCPAEASPAALLYLAVGQTGKPGTPLAKLEDSVSRDFDAPAQVDPKHQYK